MKLVEIVSLVLSIATRLFEEVVEPLLSGDEDVDDILDKPVREILSSPLRSRLMYIQKRAEALQELEGE